MSSTSTMNENLRTRIFTAEDILRIETESLASYAYQVNKHLRIKYSSEESFTAFWAGERRRLRLDGGEATAPLDPKVRQEWDRSPSLREEFGGSFQVYAAYLRADREGRVRIAGKT